MNILKQTGKKNRKKNHRKSFIQLLRKIFEIKSSFGEDCLQTEVEFEKNSYEEECETGNFMLYVKYALLKR
jgi:hypothetical protein